MYHTLILFPCCLPGLHLGIFLIAFTDTLSNTGLTACEIAIRETAPSVSMQNLTTTVPLILFRIASLGYIVFLEI